MVACWKMCMDAHGVVQLNYTCRIFLFLSGFHLVSIHVKQHNHTIASWDHLRVSIRLLKAPSSVCWGPRLNKVSAIAGHHVPPRFHQPIHRTKTTKEIQGVWWHGSNQINWLHFTDFGRICWHACWGYVTCDWNETWLIWDMDRPTLSALGSWLGCPLKTTQNDSCVLSKKQSVGSGKGWIYINCKTLALGVLQKIPTSHKMPTRLTIKATFRTCFVRWSVAKLLPTI